MIVCSCNVITRRDVESVIEEILVADPYAVLTPNLLYHRLGRRGKCCGCFPHVSRILVEHGTLVRADDRGRRTAAGGADDAEEAPPPRPELASRDIRKSAVWNHSKNALSRARNCSRKGSHTNRARTT